jgi:hypothetical protein
MPSIAEETRRAVDRTPHLRRALREGILNYTAAARRLGVDADPEAVASALRRYESELPPLPADDRSVRVRMERHPEPEILAVGGRTPETTALTAIRVAGVSDGTVLARALSTLRSSDVSVAGAGFLAEEAILLVESGDGSTALRHVEAVRSE